MWLTSLKYLSGILRKLLLPLVYKIKFSLFTVNLLICLGLVLPIYNVLFPLLPPVLCFCFFPFMSLFEFIIFPYSICFPTISELVLLPFSQTIQEHLEHLKLHFCCFFLICYCCHLFRFSLCFQTRKTLMLLFIQSIFI